MTQRIILLIHSTERVFGPTKTKYTWKRVIPMRWLLARSIAASGQASTWLRGLITRQTQQTKRKEAETNTFAHEELAVLSASRPNERLPTGTSVSPGGSGNQLLPLGKLKGIWNVGGKSQNCSRGRDDAYVDSRVGHHHTRSRLSLFGSLQALDIFPPRHKAIILGT